MAKRKKSFAEKIVDMPTSELSSMTQGELMKELKKGRFALTRRLGAFKRAGLESAAAVQYFDTGKLRREKTPDVNRATIADVARKKKIEDMSRNQLLLELARIQSFFRSKTSTVKGQKETNRQWDIAIFGVDPETGAPRDTLTEQERTEFWSTYQEYYNQHNETFSNTGASESIQRLLGELIKSTTINHDDLARKIKIIHEAYTKEESVAEAELALKPEEEVGNVYSGTRGNKNVRTKRGNRRAR